MNKKKAQVKQYIDHSGQIFELVGECRQQSESSHGRHIETYPSVLLKNVKTGEMISVMLGRLDLSFSPHFTEIKTFKEAQKFIEEAVKNDLSELLSNENIIKLNQAAEVYAKSYINKWFPHVDVHPDFKKVIEHIFGEVLMSASLAISKHKGTETKNKK